MFITNLLNKCNDNIQHIVTNQRYANIYLCILNIIIYCVIIYNELSNTYYFQIHYISHILFFIQTEAISETKNNLELYNIATLV